jgi:hypothetical protein
VLYICIDRGEMWIYSECFYRACTVLYGYIALFTFLLVARYIQREENGISLHTNRSNRSNTVAQTNLKSSSTMRYN